MRCKELLKTNGMLIVTENMFEGYLGSNVASHLIYTITATRWPWFVRLAERFFNTAGVGVCFQSQRALDHMFAQTGFNIATFQRGLGMWWLRPSFLRVMYPLLFGKSVAHCDF